MSAEPAFLPRTSNQARGLAAYAIEFLAGAEPLEERVLRRVELFHADSVGCAVAALGCGTNAPAVLRAEAFDYPAAAGSRGAYCFGSQQALQPEKAVLANVSAVRELDANGTNFGYNPITGDCRGEFGHNDFYPVALAAAGQAGWDGGRLLAAMLCLDEIRGRLAEVFGLKDHKVDHVVHGAIASTVVYGAALGASAGQIESALGLLLAHYIPFRAIRAGHQLSDSKGASAAISSELAVLSVHRALRGFVGPADIFRNPQAIFCLFEPPAKAHESPFDLRLARGGSDFAVMGMHFKLGLYEHQSAGAIHGLLQLLERHPTLITSPEDIQRIQIQIYEPAFSIICDPAKRDPRTRQSADHSMLYIVATLLRKAMESQSTGWESLMLLPDDYDQQSLLHPLTRQLMQRIELQHGGSEFDARYPDGIPTRLWIEHRAAGRLDSGFIMYPLGHSREHSGRCEPLLRLKFQRLATLGTPDPDGLWKHLTTLAAKSADEVRHLYCFSLRNELKTQA